MTLTKLPLVPQWKIPGSCVCTPDGGFLYVGYRSINFISKVKTPTEEPLIRAFHTRQSVLNVDVDPYWGKSVQNGAEQTTKVPNEIKLFAILSQDRSVQIWDFNKGCAIQGHKAHCSNLHSMDGPLPQIYSSVVLMGYMCNRNILSIDYQDIVVYCVTSNSFCRRPLFVPPRNNQLTALKCSSYNENHFAVGTRRGLVLLCDLQQMIILYTLRGHDSAIISLSWNRIDVCPSAKLATNTEQEKTAKKLFRSETVDADDIFDIYDYDYLDNEFGAPPQETMQKSGFEVDYVSTEKPRETTATAKFDFAEACENLKEEINAMREDQPQVSHENAVTLEECKQAACHNDLSSSCGDEEDDEHTSMTDHDSESLDALSRSSTDESVHADGVDRKSKQQVLVEVHASQTLDHNKKKCDFASEDGSPEQASQLLCEAKINSKESNTTEESGNRCLQDVLLASASLDGSFWVWNASMGSSCDNRKVRSSHGGKNSHVQVQWLNATTLLSSNKNGELQFWELQPLPIDEKYDVRIYKFKENKRKNLQQSVVGFSTFQGEQLLWCVSSRREISLEDIAAEKFRLKFGCVSTNIGAMCECPDDMNKIALGFSDRRIGITDISNMTSTQVHIQNFSCRIDSAVLSLAWSPDSKKIAFGTAEGRVGVLNVESSGKQQTTIFNPIYGKPIYSICWLEKHIFVVCNERIAIYDDESPSRDALVIPNISGVSTLSVYNNYLFVGTQKGHLHLYARRIDADSKQSFESVQQLELTSRYITGLAWSPLATNRLATVANANSIYVLDFNEVNGKLKIYRKIEINSPKAANAWVKWSNHNANIFVTFGFDGAVRVWDLSHDSKEECFVKHYHCPMTCGLFLPNDEKIVICCGKSTSLELIDMRVEKTDDTKSKTKRCHSRITDNVQWATKALTRNNGKVTKPAIAEKKSDCRPLKMAKREVEQITEQTDDENLKHNNNNCEEVSTMLENLNLEKHNQNSSMFLKNPPTLLYLLTKELNKDALNVMYNWLTIPSHKKSDQNISLTARLYGSKMNAKHLLEEELKNHQHSETKGIAGLFMSQLNNNIKDEILKCVQAKQLNEWHVSLAPTVSHSFWLKCCQAFAEQLIDQGGYALQAATYMLAIHRHQDAIQMLLNQKYFKEALLIARIYLQAEDPLINTITEQWINHFCTVGNLTGAALLSLLSNQKNRAYECLAKIRNNSPDVERILKLLKSSDTP
ncbi:protein rigor mortis [Glossina fuscipes]|uniref:Protein rigor mortis n=1 Tax=Glossina fuscipes TaxID=7396 RepID=A0A9C5YYX9_9MUSC|nr:protein rigor mortis [Glossina fuscipes]